MTKRYAIFYAPPAQSHVWRRAAQWLGRDALTGAELTQPKFGELKPDELVAATISARRYGFHATIKPPMALAPRQSEAGLIEAIEDFCRKANPVPIGAMQLQFIDGFLAIIPVNQSTALTSFAADCVVGFDRFRQPMSANERAQRLGSHLSDHHIELLDLYGYPYVLDQFRLHLTLTDRLPEAERPKYLAAATEWFGPALQDDWTINALSLYREDSPDAAFRRIMDFPIGGSGSKSA